MAQDGREGEGVVAREGEYLPRGCYDLLSLELYQLYPGGIGIETDQGKPDEELDENENSHETQCAVFAEGVVVDLWTALVSIV